MPATTINEVIDQLEEVISYCITHNNRAGYFAALYHRVTCRIRDGILAKEFEDNERMEKLDVIFANFFLDAWHKWISKETPSQSWSIAFEAAANKGIIMQHLLLGINAHINLDLGVATADTMKGYPIDGIQKDFNTINTVLASLTDAVKSEIFKVSPLMKLLDRIGGRFDEMLVEFSINTARDGAWRFATELSAKTGIDYSACISTRDEAIAMLGKNIAQPSGKIFSVIVGLISVFEWRSTSKVIETLHYVAAKAAEQTKPVFNTVAPETVVSN